MTGPPTPLSDLINRARATEPKRTGFPALVDRTRDQNGQPRISVGYLAQLADADATLRMPSPEHIAALADMLGIDQWRVYLAALIQYQPPGSELLQAALIDIYERQYSAAVIADALHAIADAEREAPGEPDAKSA